jgi:serine protease inhibitor ecotin
VKRTAKDVVQQKPQPMTEKEHELKRLEIRLLEAKAREDQAVFQVKLAQSRVAEAHCEIMWLELEIEFKKQ